MREITKDAIFTLDLLQLQDGKRNKNIVAEFEILMFIKFSRQQVLTLGTPCRAHDSLVLLRNACLYIILSIHSYIKDSNQHFQRFSPDDKLQDNLFMATRHGTPPSDCSAFSGLGRANIPSLSASKTLFLRLYHRHNLTDTYLLF